jgi:crotonobetainyl-CoA:carnitine CoA-transferase CaiB-like acyl-CoA transferase
MALTEALHAALRQLRVLDLTSSSSAYCGRILADLGADVVKVESPAGDPSRLEAPHSELAPRPESLSFLYGNAGKKSVVVDLTEGAGRERFRQLAASSDLILESEPAGRLSSLGLGFSDLALNHRALIMTSITGFGQTGPESGFRSNDLVTSALGGLMISVGDALDPPLRLAGHQTEVISAVFAAASSLIAVFHRDRTGQGQHVDISRLEVTVAATHIAGVGKWLEDGIIPKRVGTGLVASVPSGAYRCRDGLVYLMVNRPAHWEALARWIQEVTGNEEVLSSEFRGASSIRLPYRELLDVFIGSLATTLSVDEMVREGQSRHIAVTPIATARSILEDPDLRERNFFVDLMTESGRVIRAPGLPFRSISTNSPDSDHDDLDTAGPAGSASRMAAPTIGQHDTENLPAIRRDGKRSAGLADPAMDTKGALAGLRIVEFGTGLAVPWIGRILAWAGADVIKIESHAFPDVPRLFVPPREPELGTQPECSPWFTDWSAGKRFVALDLRRSEGAELARRIARRSDAVISNYSVGVLDKLGLGYHALSEGNPELLMLESNGFGKSGSKSRYVTWGPNIEAASGMASLGGFPNRDCSISHFAYPDPLSAAHGLVALLAGLILRESTSVGQQIELSQLEATIAAMGPLMLEAADSGREPKRRGNRELDLAPYGCFPCQGTDRWVVICVEDEADWRQLRKVMGEPDWANESRYSSMRARLEFVDELEAKISQWTRTLVDYDIMAKCQRAGIAAGVVQNAEDLFRHDPQLADREFFEEISHFKKGKVVASGIPLGLTATPGRTTHAGSRVGQDNQSVLREVLGFSDSEIQHWLDVGALEESG